MESKISELLIIALLFIDCFVYLLFVYTYFSFIRALHFRSYIFNCLVPTVNKWIYVLHVNVNARCLVFMFKPAKSKPISIHWGIERFSERIIGLITVTTPPKIISVKHQHILPCDSLVCLTQKWSLDQN